MELLTKNKNLDIFSEYLTTIYKYKSKNTIKLQCQQIKRFINFKVVTLNMALEKTIKTLKLKKIELPIRANDKRIKPNTFYLAKIDMRDEAMKQLKKSGRGFIGWYAGKFTKPGYGWDFDGVYDAGFQYDYPGWKELYEIEDKEITEFYKKLGDTTC